MPYDILFDRQFNSRKIAGITDITYQKMDIGLRKSISEYIKCFDQQSFSQTIYDDVVDKFVSDNNLHVWGC